MFTTNKETNANTAKDNMASEGAPVADAKETVRRFKGEARDAANAVKDDIEEVARRTGQHARDLADAAGHSLEDFGDTVIGKIRKKPVQSTVIAVGVGILFGMLYRR